MPYIMSFDKVQIGTKLFRWTILSIPANARDKVHCRCECGNERSVQLSCILRGESNGCKSCSIRDRNLVHGHRVRGRKDRLYTIWKGMNQRCGPAAGKNAELYYDRGIRVCEAWATSFPVFRDWALANGYRDDLSIDRWPDSNGNYEPANCRWANATQQVRGRTVARIVTAFGETKPMIEWSHDPRCMVSYKDIHGRLRLGWAPEDAITRPPFSRRVKAGHLFEQI